MLHRSARCQHPESCPIIRFGNGRPMCDLQSPHQRFSNALIDFKNSTDSITLDMETCFIKRIFQCEKLERSADIILDDIRSQIGLFCSVFHRRRPLHRRFRCQKCARFQSFCHDNVLRTTHFRMQKTGKLCGYYLGRYSQSNRPILQRFSGVLYSDRLGSVVITWANICRLSRSTFTQLSLVIDICRFVDFPRPLLIVDFTQRNAAGMRIQKIEIGNEFG